MFGGFDIARTRTNPTDRAIVQIDQDGTKVGVTHGL
jgi:hypothetical protein